METLSVADNDKWLGPCSNPLTLEIKMKKKVL